MTNLKYTPDEPIAAIATALAPAALGIVRCSGKNCIELLSKIFSRPKALLEAKGNSIVYGWIQKEERIDEVLVSVFRSPKSFTGEDMAEISCHGGVHVVQTIYNLLLKNGFRAAERGEFTFRSYINGKADLTKAEAVREIIDSKTDESQSRAAGRLAGNLYETIDGVKKHIIDTLAAIEVEIEYPEDEETIADSFDSAELKKAEKVLVELSESWKSEKIYQDGARVVLCGKTNAGKSSLFNALLKEDRAIVSDIEGTTRDFIESWIDFSGIPARIFDTAGLRETEDKIEAVGVERTKDLSKEADLILYLVDSKAGLTQEDEEFIKSHCEDGTPDSHSLSRNDKKSVPLILVWNKCDLGEEILRQAPNDRLLSLNIPQVRIAAKKGIGLGKLSEAVKNALSFSKSTESRGTGLGSERQKLAVERALESVRHALALSDDFALDAVVQDLEDSLDALGEITGDVTPEDILGSIFANFCVGK